MVEQDSSRHDERIEVMPATANQESVLANLLELYAHDFSEFHDVELGADGRFGYHDLPLYWTDADRYPFLVKVDGGLAGFVLVRRGSRITSDAAVWDVAEFFVARRYRRRGVGGAVAKKVWEKFPGRWEGRVMESNHTALAFWEHAVAEFTGTVVQPSSAETGGGWWLIFAFTSATKP